MKLSELFSTPQRKKLLEEVLSHPSRKVKTSKLASETGLSLGLASNYLKLLKKEGLVKEKVNLENPEVQSLKRLLNLNALFEAGVPSIIKKNLPGIKGVGVYGSWASGTNTEDSDLDVWVKTQKKPGDPLIARTRRKIEEKTGTRTSILMLTSKRLEELKENDKPFYSSLFHSTVLWGERI
jgi:predicted nucleotidyltransferase